MEQRSLRVGPRQSDVVETEIDGDIGLYHPHNQEVFVLNSTASDVWRLCDGEHTVDQVVGLLAGAYRADPADIAGEVAQAVQMFTDGDLYPHDIRALTAGKAHIVGRVLLGSVIEHDWRVPPEGMAALVAGHPLAGLPAAAAYHGVAGCVYRSLHGLLLPAPTRHQLEAAYHHGLKGHLRALGDLKNLAPVLDGLEVPWLVVKGPVLSTSIYGRPDLRAYGDLDVVVPAGSLGAVLTALLHAGCRLVDRNWVLLHERVQGEIHLVLPFGTPLDLHWHLLNEASLREVFHIPMGALIERARWVEVEGTTVRTLDQTDTLVYLGLHGCLSGANRLVWLKDVERAIAADDPSWDDVVERAQEWGAGVAVATTFGQARRLLSAGVPEDVERALSPSRPWRALSDLAFRLAPVERSVGRRSPPRMLARSVRDNPWASAVELGRHAVGGLFGGAPLRRQPATDDIDPASTGSILHPAGDERDLEAFLTTVARQRGPAGH